MEIQQLHPEHLTDADREQIRALFRQLNPELIPQNPAAVLDHPHPPTLVVCREQGRILGMATLCTYTVLSGCKAWVEDVVVDAEARGKGIARRLMEHLIEMARAAGAREILLYTGHHRLPAHRLYAGLGFLEKDSKLMRLPLQD